MPAPTAVINLIDTFHRNRDAYRAAAQTPNEKTTLQRQIKTADHQIDHLVYELYELTDEEIAIVE